MNNAPANMPALTPEAAAWINLLASQPQPAQEDTVTVEQPVNNPLAFNQLLSSRTLFLPDEHASVDDFPFSFDQSSPDSSKITSLQLKVDTLKNQLAAVKRKLEEAEEKKIDKRFKLSGAVGDMDSDKKIVREELMRQIRYTLKSLIGGSEGRPDGQDVMVPNFKCTAKEPPNLEIIERAAELVADDHKSGDGTYELEGQEFTMDDLRTFAKQTFNGWKESYGAEKDAEKKKKEIFQKKNCRHVRQVALSRMRSKAKETYETRHNCKLPDEVFDLAYMTKYHSGLDTAEVSRCSDVSDSKEGTKKKKEIVEEAKASHYIKMAEEAHLSYKDQALKVPVWEKRKKTFRSKKFNEMIDEFDKIVDSEKAQKKRRGHVRVLVSKVDFGTKDSSPPSGKEPLLPFMVDGA